MKEIRVTIDMHCYQKAKFKMAYIGESRNTTKVIDKFRILQVRLIGSTTLDQYQKLVN